FYRDKLGFTGEWLWDDPPTFGGVRWGKVSVLFCLQPALAARVEGHQHYFHVSGIDQLYERHRQNGVPIVSPLQAQPWGRRESTARSPTGAHRRYGHPTTPHPSWAPAKPLSEDVRLVERLPTVAEYETLVRAVGWAGHMNLEAAPAALRNTLYAVVAVEG